MTKEKPVVDLSTLPIDPILRLPQVLKIFPVSKSSWWAGVKEGIYPAQIRLGKRSVGWKLSAILELSREFEAKHLENGKAELKG